MEIDFSGGRLWHTDCDKNTHNSGIVKALKHDDESSRSLVKCLHCEKQGYYPYGRVGRVCCEEAPT